MTPFPITDKEGALFIDGPVAICISAGTETKILEAYERLGKLIAVAAKLTGERHAQASVSADWSESSQFYGRWGRTN